MWTFVLPSAIMRYNKVNVKQRLTTYCTALFSKGQSMNICFSACATQFIFTSIQVRQGALETVRETIHKKIVMCRAQYSKQPGPRQAKSSGRENYVSLSLSLYSVCLLIYKPAK